MVNDDELQSMIDEFDRDGDGESNRHESSLFNRFWDCPLVNLDEFLAMLNED